MYHTPCNTPPLIAMKPTLAQLTTLKMKKGEKIKIIESVAPRWKNLGDLLDLDAEGRTLSLIEADHRQGGPCCLLPGDVHALVKRQRKGGYLGGSL